MTKEVALLEHQLEFINDTTTPYLGLVGGYGCGKTLALVAKTVVLASKNVGYEGALFEPTYPQVKRVLVPTMLRFLDEIQLPYEYQKGESYFDLFFGKGSTRVHLMSGENYVRLVGMNLAFAGIDEADVMRLDDIQSLFDQCIARLRRGKVRQLFTTSTPEGFKFLYEFFVKQNADDRKLIRGKTSSNPFLPEDYVEKIRSQYPAHLISAYLEGEFVNLNSATIYVSFDREASHTDFTFRDFPNHVIHVGQDFNKGNMSSVLGVVEGGQMYILGEIMRGHDTMDVIQKLQRRFPNRKFLVYPDASVSAHTGVSDVQLFQQHGMKCFYNSNNPRVSDRINAVNRMLCDGNGVRRMKINTNECPVLTDCLTRQAYSDGKPDKASGLDHAPDALGYLVNWLFPIQKKNVLRIG